jgi:hypothetical protein
MYIAVLPGTVPLDVLSAEVFVELKLIFEPRYNAIAVVSLEKTEVEKSNEKKVLEFIQKMKNN